MKTIDKVHCVRVERRTSLDRHQVFILAVTWSDKKTYEVARTYSAFFDFRAALSDAFKGKQEIKLPALHGTRWFERGILGNSDATLEKKRQGIEEFCQQILQMPKAVTKSDAVISFFERWHADLEVDSGRGKPGSRDKGLKSHKGEKGGEKARDKGGDRDHDVKVDPTHNDQSLDQQVYLQEQYIAVMDFNGSQPGEVSLKSGCHVDVQQKDLSGWWFVFIEETKEEGWAPSTLLCPADPAKQVPEESPEHGQEGLGKFRAISKCEGHDADEVSYKKGDVVEVLNASLDGWWKVCVKGKTGFTPATNLEPVKDGKDVATGAVSKLKASLYHHQSIYKKHNPPPRRQSTESLSELYAKVVKRPRQKTGNPTLQYTEVSFDDDNNGLKRPIIVDSEKGEVGTTYAEIVISPAIRANDINQSKSKRSVPPPPLLKSQSVGEVVEDEMYANSPTIKPAISFDVHEGPPQTTRMHSYENIGTDLDEEFYRVIKDHTPSPGKKGALPLRKGDIVMSLKRPHKEVPQTLVYCVLCAKAHTPQVGWVPKDVLFEINISVIDQKKHPIPQLGTGQDPGGRVDHGHRTAPPKVAPGAAPHSNRPVPSPRGINHPEAHPKGSPPLLPTRGRLTPEPQARDTPVEHHSRGRSPPKHPEDYHRPSNGFAKGKSTPVKDSINHDPTPKSPNTAVRALFDHSTTAGNCLSFRAGDVGMLRRVNDDGWWCVILDCGKEGWVPADYWQEEQHVSTPVASRKTPRAAAPESKDEKHHDDPNNGPWFVGVMNRADCESLLLKYAKPREFVIRASTNRVGDYTLSVMYEKRVRHFPIELRGEGKYNIGKHDFKNLTKVVKYYTLKPIFYDDTDQSICLGLPLQHKS